MRTVPLINRQGQITAYATVDDEDFPFVAAWTWHEVRAKGAHTTYAGRGTVDASGKSAYVLMHRAILEHQSPIPDGYEVDHVNRSGLNNRRSNLRLVTHSQNGLNQRVQRNSLTGFRGVSRCPKCRSGYTAMVVIKRVRHRLGHFTTAAEAGRVASEWRKANTVSID